MRSSNLIAAAVAALTVSAGSAIAADKETVLTGITAPVMVNQGETYVEAQEGMLLYPGDQLMTLKGGSAQVQYANGCVQALAENAISRVGTEEACSTASSAGTYNQAGSASGSGGGGGGDNVGAMIIAAGAAGGFLYNALDDDNNNNPPSVSP